jgi:hypothetical protein
MLEMDLGREDTAGSVSQFQGQGSAQHSEIHRAVRDRREPESLPGRGVHPVLEPGVADGERETPEQQRLVMRAVVQLFGEPDGLMDGFDNNPLVVRAAQWLSLDDLAGDPETAQAGDGFLDRASAADA